MFMDEANITLYEMIGGETELRELVDRFYDVMDSAPEARKVRAIHPEDLTHSRDKFFMFLSGWSGGPEKSPPPVDRVDGRSRFASSSVEPQARPIWLLVSSGVSLL